MKRQIEVTASFSGKISTGQWENMNPFFAVKESFEIDDVTPEVDRIIEARQSELQAICISQFRKQADLAYQDKIEKTYKNIRFYDSGLGDGVKYPSVTSVIDMDENFFMADDELAQYGARGHVIHKQVEIFLQTGKWLEPKEIPDIAFQVATVLKGTLNLSLDDVSFVNFYKDYPFKTLKQETTVINHEYKYGGRYDILGIIESTNKGKWDKIEGIQFDVPTLLDVKTATTVDKLKGFTQQAAYAKTDESIKQIALILLTKDNQCGYAKPAITNKLDHYWSIFLNKRSQFKERYSI